MLGDGTSWNYFYYVPLHFEELCFRGHELGACWSCVRPQHSWKSTRQAQARTEVNGVLPLLSWSQVSNSGVKEALPPTTTSSYAARTGCALSLSHAYHKYSNADLVTRKLNYCNTLLAELRARLLSAACCSLRAWQHVCSALWASRNALHHAAFFTLPASEVADWF